MNRRDFVKTSFAAAPLFVPRSAWGANDRPTFGSIGVGNRGGWLNQTFQKLGAQCVALCDVYQPYLERARANCPADVKTYVNHHDLLGQSGIDFVVIGTPDHHHCPQLLDALAARKDVYVEKPLSMNLAESDKMVAAARASDRIVQVGMQRRSMPFIHKAKRLIDEGTLGQVSIVKAMWNWHFTVPLDNSPLAGKLDWELFQGAAPHRPLEPKRFRWWRGFYDYSGGNMTDQGTHLMDVSQWLTGAGTPLAASASGYIRDAKGGEVPDVFSAVFEYPNLLVTWTLDYASSQDHDWSILFQGEKASLLLNRHGSTLFRDSGATPAPWSAKGEPDIIAKEPDVDSGDAHQQNFLDCIRSRKQPSCTVETAAAAVKGPHMANLSLRQDRKIRA